MTTTTKAPSLTAQRKRLATIRRELMDLRKAIGPDFSHMARGAMDGSDLFHRHFNLYCEAEAILLALGKRARR